MKKKIKFIIIIGVLVVAAYAAVVFILKEKGINKSTIKVSGNIEGDDVRISFRVAGQIEELLTDEGKVIKKDDVVARLKKDELGKIQAEA
ncbi:MAG: biotin/lipoyl-binding protein, partial [Candidatus Omnitrophota bacterium]